MNVEVELKYRVEHLGQLRRQLLELNAVFSPPELQVDHYFAHPVRDFATTDEALRIRSVGDRSWITYKGPKLDSTTKTRHEIELALAQQNVGGLVAELWEALGFQPVAMVRKTRHEGHVVYDSQRITIALDNVDDVGEFAEFEIVSPEPQFESARDTLLSFTQSLRLSASERRSYLELLLAGKG